MERAGAAAASEIALRYGDRLDGGALVFAGPGNNGGDAWVVARALAASGVAVRVIEVVAAATADAIAERGLAVPFVDIRAADAQSADSVGGERLVVDGLLGTGSSGAPRGDIGAAVQRIAALRDRGATVVALDVPTGVDASTGRISAAAGADLTLTFGTVKRGHLVARDACGDIAVLDIGLGVHASMNDGAPLLVDERWVAARVPSIAASAHKGTRKKLAICGGARGMAGASILAARAAMRSGVGMVRLVVHEASLDAVQEAEPFALAGRWPGDDAAVDHEITAWADAVVLGPGLGNSPETRALVERILAGFHGPVVLDADALNVFEGEPDALARALGPRVALLTPHPAEFARLARTTVDDVLANRFDVGQELARRTTAAVLLKGVPTVVSAPNGSTLVCAAGTPVLAAAGSGDILSGIAGTLLAQMNNALDAGAAAAWVHGRAAERVSARATSAAAGRAETVVRGVTLADVVDALSLGWTFDVRSPRYPVLGELARVGEGERA